MDRAPTFLLRLARGNRFVQDARHYARHVMLNNTSARRVLAVVVEPLARGLLRMGVSPDAVTLVGTLGAATGALVFFPRQQWFVGTIVIVAFIFSDMLDGTMARLSGRQGPWGAYLDSTLDRVGDGAIFTGLALGFMAAGDTRTAAVALACLVGGAVVSYAKARAEGLGATANVGIAERAERLLIALFAAGFYGLGIPYVLPAALWVLAVLSWVTVAQRMWHVRGQLRSAPEPAP